MDLLKKISQYTIPITCLLGALIFAILVTLTAGLTGDPKGEWMVLASYLFSTVLIFTFGRYRLNLTLPSSLSLAALSLMNPLGIDILASSQNLEYSLTLNLILIALIIYDLKPPILTSVLLLAVGIVGMFTSYWVELMPLILACYAIGKEEPTQPLFIKLAPISILLGLSCYTHIDPISITSWGKVFAHFISSPIAILFPHFDTEVYRSWIGFLIVIIVYSLFVVKRNRLATTLLFSSLLSAFPWVLAPEMDPRYLFLATPALYMAIVLILNDFEDAIFLSLILPIFLVLQFMWMSERGLNLIKTIENSRGFQEKIDAKL